MLKVPELFSLGDTIAVFDITAWKGGYYRWGITVDFIFGVATQITTLWSSLIISLCYF